MNEVTVALTSDNHLGAYYARYRPERLEERRRALQRGFEQVVDTALARRVHLFLHAGDLFDRPDPRNAERTFVARQFRRLQEAGIPVCAIAGNHDAPRSYGYDGGTLPLAEMEALGALRLFGSRSEWQRAEFLVHDRRVCVWGMSYDPSLPPDVCPLEDHAARHARGGDVDLVLLHYGVEGWAPTVGQEPCLTRAGLERMDTDALCVGHLHARNQTRLQSGALLLNPGATEHIHFGEERRQCGFWLLRFRPGAAEAEYVPVRAQPMRTLSHTLTETDFAIPEGSLDPLMPRLLAELEAVSAANQLLRIQLEGKVPRSQLPRLDLPQLQTQGNEWNFHCQLDTEHLVVYDEFAELALGFGVSFDAAEELQNVAEEFQRQVAEDPTEREICRLAAARIAEDYERWTGGAR